MPTPNNQAQIDFLIDLISQGKSYVESLVQFGAKWGKSKNTFERRWIIANNQYKEAQKLINDKVSELTTKETLKAAQNGLKLKLERVLSLQKMIDDNKAEIATFNKEGKLLKGWRQLTPNEIVMINAEISKMQGEYAPTKADITTNPTKIKIEWEK
jgi:hypothetical protein